MTAQEVYRAVLNELEHEYTKTMTPDEFNHHIAVAEYEYIKTRYWAHEQHEKSIADLQVIKIITDGIAGAPALIPNAGIAVAGQEWIQMPSDLLYLLNVAVIARYKGVSCQKDGTDSPPIAATYLPDDRMHIVEKDYYNKPIAQFPRLYYMRRADKMTFKLGQSIVRFVSLTYLRQPAPAQLDSSGNSLINPIWAYAQQIEIVKWCVHSYLGKIEEMRFQVESALLGKSFEQAPPPNI
jgi:hypothetical protein